MKHELNEIIQNDNSRNKNATRYIRKSHPKLWQQILNATAFLPLDAKPKQRIWHILNDVFERPKCPVTGEYVKWWENRYLETVNKSAASTLCNRQNKRNTNSKDTNEKRAKTLREGYTSGRLKAKFWTEDEIADRYEKIEKATLEKYGVKSTLLLPEVREKQYQTKVANGLITPKELKSDRQKYYEEVSRHTKLSWIKHFDRINPNRLDRSKWDLDHIFSVQEGFRQNIDPIIISHYTNLRMIDPRENSRKGMRCDKTLEHLLKDYNKRG